MVKFILGFLVAWIIISTFLNFTDHKNCGINLYEGWASTVVLLPLLIIVFPFFFVYKLYKYISNKVYSKYTELKYRHRHMY